MKKIFTVLICIIGIFLVSKNLFNTSFGYSYEIDKSVLFYKDDFRKLENDIKKYIANVDDYIIPNSSYLYSDKLINNYDFLVHFATDYVINNKEYYVDYINSKVKCSYKDRNGIDNYTNDYVNMDVIYDLTQFYFGVSDFSIINDDVCFNDGYISLTDYNAIIFNEEIVDVKVYELNNEIKALISYENGINYLYTFSNDNNILKIVNVEVE